MWTGGATVVIGFEFDLRFVTGFGYSPSWMANSSFAWIFTYSSDLAAVDGALPKWRHFLSKLSKVGIHEDHNADGTHPDGISTIDITALGESVSFFIWEYKRILGEGGCDPSVQAGRGMDPARCEFYCSKYHDDLT